MRLNPLLLLSVAGCARAQTLADILAAESAYLSTLNAWLTSQPTVYQILSNAQGVTMLAPSNNALNSLYSTTLATQLAADANMLTAFLSYHVLDGIYSISNLSRAEAVAVPTYMNMAAYSNVTGGQVVLACSPQSDLNLISGNNVQSNVQTYVCLVPPRQASHAVNDILTVTGLQLHRRHPPHNRHGPHHTRHAQ